MAIQTATATFTGAEDSVAVTWPALGYTPAAISIGPCTSDSLGVVDAFASSVTSTGCTITPTARFTGTVEVIVQ